MRIRNQVFLKRPWLFPVFSTIGAASVFFQGPAVSPTIKIAIFFVVLVLLNAFFFAALRRTQRNQDPPET
jgi:hypothetical protein